MINEQFLLRKINEQLRDMPEARNRIKNVQARLPCFC